MVTQPVPGPGEEIPVELDDSGLSADVERDETEERIDHPFDPEQIEVQTRTPTIGLLMSRLRRDTLDLAPDFQRHSGIWDEQAQSRLIESLLLRITLPTLYAAEDDQDSWAVVYGVQRLTTIARFVTPELVRAPRLRLRGLQYLDMYEGLSFDELPGRLQTRIEETELIVLLIRRGTPEEVKFNIFARINTGGRPLTRQELRHALIPGPARNLLATLASSQEFRRATGGGISQDRMSDREMCLRVLAFMLSTPESYATEDFDGFLRSTMHRINALSDAQRDELERAFCDAMTAAHQVFGEHAFRKQFRGQTRRSPVNKALCEVQTVCLARRTTKEQKLLTDRAPAVRELLLDSMADGEFFKSVSAGTGDVGKVKYRFREMDRILEEALRA